LLAKSSPSQLQSGIGKGIAECLRHQTGNILHRLYTAATRHTLATKLAALSIAFQ